MEISYHGHSVIQVKVNNKKIIFDPFINGNKTTDLKVKDIICDVIILTHGHNDHVGDTIEIAKKNNALVIAVAELASYLNFKGVENVHPMSIGGSYKFDFGTVKLTSAIHGSSYIDENENIIYTGMPAGVILTANDKTIYHAGDTALFSDMKIIGEQNSIDLAFLPIGDNFTMGPQDAVIAAKYINAKKVVPIHYNTFPLIQQNPTHFIEMLEEDKGIVLLPGENLRI